MVNPGRCIVESNTLVAARRESDDRWTERGGSEREVMPMNCNLCGELLFSALQRTRGVCASCFLSYKPQPKAAIGRTPASQPRASRPEDREPKPPKISGSGNSGQETP